jgi:hypothetical protein
MSGASATSNFFSVTGTMPASPSVDVAGSLFNITTSGSPSTIIEEGVRINLLPGYTGAYQVSALGVTNTVAGTGSDAFAPIGNVGINARSAATTTGSNIGIRTAAQGGNINYGLFSSAFVAKDNSRDIGVAGFAKQSGGTNRIAHGGIFGLYNADVVYATSAALIADNGAIAAPVIEAFDNNSKKWSIEDGGAMWAANSKTLTESSATTFATLTVPTGTTVNGEIPYNIETASATPHYQIEFGTLVFGCTNNAGTTACALARPNASTTVDQTTDNVQTTSGTLTNTFTYADGGSGVVSFKANAVSSLTQTLLRINYFFVQYGNAADAFAPQ